MDRKAASGKKKFRNGHMICFELYGGLKLPQIGPDDLFFYIWPLQGHSQPSSDGFRGVSKGFQRGLKLCGFREVSERSETVWFLRSFKKSKSAWFQRGSKGF